MNKKKRKVEPEKEPELWAGDGNAKGVVVATIGSMLLLWWMAAGCPGCLR